MTEIFIINFIIFAIFQNIFHGKYVKLNLGILN